MNRGPDDVEVIEANCAECARLGHERAVHSDDVPHGILGWSKTAPLPPGCPLACVCGAPLPQGSPIENRSRQDEHGRWHAWECPTFVLDAQGIEVTGKELP